MLACPQNFHNQLPAAVHASLHQAIAQGGIECQGLARLEPVRLLLACPVSSQSTQSPALVINFSETGSSTVTAACIKWPALPEDRVWHALSGRELVESFSTVTQDLSSHKIAGYKHQAERGAVHEINGSRLLKLACNVRVSSVSKICISQATRSFETHIRTGAASHRLEKLRDSRQNSGAPTVRICDMLHLSTSCAEWLL